MRTLQIIIAVIIGIAVSVFAIENMAPVSISFAGASAQVPLIVLIAGLLALGFILGKTIRIWPRSKPKSHPAPARQAAPPATKPAPPPSQSFVQPAG